MKKLRNILLLVLAVLVFGGLTNVKAEGKVKVYVFEAGGCPYCEAEIEYLESLSSYGEKFEVVRKELYIDHIDWEFGKDYALGKAVAEAFNSAGFSDAAYNGTPFVVISDIYAAATYSTNLEAYIEKAYELGDKDVVGCFANGGTNCLEGADPNIQVDPTLNTNSSEDDKKDVETITTIVLLLIIGGVVALVIYTGKKNAEVKDEYVEEEVKPIVKEVKKTTSAKKTIKKTTKKSSNKKKK